jgi:SAM-dependent methyltransferase
VTDDMRLSRVLARIDLAGMRGVEIGPSFAPIVPKSSGADVVVVDHTDAASLRTKYRGHGVSVAAIEEVDVIWSGGSLAAALETRAPFDYIIASHLLEHVANPLAFLADCEALLRDGGVLSLVLPDHRYCFDVLRPPTTFGQWIDALHFARGLHTPGTVFDHWFHAAERGGIAWSSDTDVPLSMIHHRPDLEAAFELAVKGDEYVDVHAWVFTPASFRTLIDTARAFAYLRLDVVEEFDTVGFEFFVTLARSEPGPDEATRSALYRDRLVALEAPRDAERRHRPNTQTRPRRPLFRKPRTR